jgi:hypothetical protein
LSKETLQRICANEKVLEKLTLVYQ